MIKLWKNWILKIWPRFRLLNSEIGNDHTCRKSLFERPFRFRLLNSEIGNDPVVKGL